MHGDQFSVQSARHFGHQNCAVVKKVWKPMNNTHSTSAKEAEKSAMDTNEVRVDKASPFEASIDMAFPSPSEIHVDRAFPSKAHVDKVSPSEIPVR